MTRLWDRGEVFTLGWLVQEHREIPDLIAAIPLSQR